MSFLKRFKTNSSDIGHSKLVNWTNLTDINQLDEIENISHKQKVFIVKHSTRCSISTMAIKRFEKYHTISTDVLKPYFLDLISYRNISNEIALRFGIKHESPQLLLIDKGKCIYNASHDGIDASDLSNQL